MIFIFFRPKSVWIMTIVLPAIRPTNGNAGTTPLLNSAKNSNTGSSKTRHHLRTRIIGDGTIQQQLLQLPARPMLTKLNMEGGEAEIFF